MVGVFAIQGHRIKGGGQPGRRQPLAHIVEAAVGPLRATFPGEHSRRVLPAALEGEYAGRVGEFAWHIFLQAPFQYLAPVLIFREGYLGYLQVTERLGVVGNLNLLAAHLIGEVFRAVVLLLCRPFLQDGPAVMVQLTFQFIIFCLK